MSKFDAIYNKEHLAEIRRAEEESLAKQLAPHYGLPYINLVGVTINPQALLTIDEDTAREAHAAAFEKQNKKLTVAIQNPNLETTKQLIKTLEKEWSVSLMMCSTHSLEHAWKRYEDQKNSKPVQKGILDIDLDQIANLMQKITSKEAAIDALLKLRTLNSAKRVSETLEIIFAGALALGASDIHIEPEETGIRLRYRLDGVLEDIIDLERMIYERMLSRLKILAGMRLNVKDEAQDGRFTFTIEERDIDVRASIIPGAAGESMVMRLLDPDVASFQFESLGLNPALKKVMEQELQKPNGLIVTTGPTGSGKTTALYAYLQKVHTSDRKIITIEDPVEYKIDNIVQTQVSDDYSFASGLRAILRQDPDVIMVGEIRDREVAETALHAAQTGHLVFSTLHTNSAVGAFPRLIDLGVDSRVMGTSINILLGQRLVRTLCEHCKQARTATDSEEQLITRILSKHPQPPQVLPPYTVYDAVGCEACGQTGFKGRQGVFEGVQMDEAVEEALLRDPREHIIEEAARPQGIPTMAEDGMVKVIEGSTSLEELARVVELKARHTGVEEPAHPDDTAFQNHIV